MKTYTATELSEILKKHENWLYNRPSASRANLSDANLSDANLSDANLRGANLSDADLRGANLSDANLSDANLSGANLSDADLSGADLSGANLSDADLSDADLSDADLRGANLSDANLSGANLSDANLSDVRYNETTCFYALQCPEVGSFIGWKKANGYIVKLEITEDSLRSSATTRKCRCSKAKVLAIESADGSESGFMAVQSNYDSSFVYEIGETVEVKDFDCNRWHECAPGIHFFITRQEAVNYN